MPRRTSKNKWTAKPQILPGVPRALNDPDPLLTGHDPAPRIVAAQLLGDQQVRLYTRDGSNTLCQDVDFFPFFFLSHARLLEGFQRKHWLKELSGSNFYSSLAVFTRWNDLWDAARVSLENYNRTVPIPLGSFTEGEFLLLRPDPIAQFLMQTGITLFKGMAFENLKRLQISLATLTTKGTISDPRRTEDRVVGIALSDNSGWETTLDGRKLSEKEMLEGLVKEIRERDPDVIEGHDLLGHDLPYLLNRFSLNNLEFTIGRDTSEPKTLTSRWGWADSDRDATVVEIAGRHVVDTLSQVELYDFSKRSLEGYDLRALARHFHLSPATPPSTRPSVGISTWKEQSSGILLGLQANAAMIRSLSDHLSPSSFHLTQFVPLSYGTVVRTGSAIKIETLMLREYLRLKHSVPRPESGLQTTGGYADIFKTGVFSGVVHADVESLYPSIILSRTIQPRTDPLGVFPRLLRDLVTLRLRAKHAMLAHPHGEDRRRLDALQSAYKILINSFYGYLGYFRGLFNDYAKADEVTKAGQELLKAIVRNIELFNGEVIEVDTDGVFFLPPDNVAKEQEGALVDRISQSLPGGINLVIAGRFEKMMSYKKKNYAVIHKEDGLIIKGSSLTSRSMERFLRDFLRIAIGHLLDNNIAGLHTLYSTLRGDILQHRWEAVDFCKTEVIHDPFPTYERELGDGKRNPAAVYEVARISGLLPKPGDRISYYVTGTGASVKISEHCKLAEEWDPHFADENTAYYLSRLEEVTQKFETFFSSEDFHKIFATEDLFGFDPKGIAIISRKVTPEAGQRGEEPHSDFHIWLDEV